MKKALSFTLLVALMFSLAACGRSKTPSVSSSVSTPTAEQVAASATDTANAAVSMPPASATDTNAQSGYATAKNYIGRSVQDMYLAIGQPTDSSYGPVEDDDDTEEGMLFYNGFYVWTLRTETGETVQDVYLDE